MTPMAMNLNRLYQEGRATDHGLKTAVKRGMITPEEYKLITEKDYEPLPDEYPYGLDTQQLEDVEQKYRDKVATEVSGSEA